MDLGRIPFLKAFRAFRNPCLRKADDIAHHKARNAIALHHDLPWLLDGVLACKDDGGPFSRRVCIASSPTAVTV